MGGNGPGHTRQTLPCSILLQTWPDINSVHCHVCCLHLIIKYIHFHHACKAQHYSIKNFLLLFIFHFQILWRAPYHILKLSSPIGKIILSSGVFVFVPYLLLESHIIGFGQSQVFFWDTFTFLQFLMYIFQLSNFLSHHLLALLNFLACQFLLLKFLFADFGELFLSLCHWI